MRSMGLCNRLKSEAEWKDNLLGEVSSKIFTGDIGPYESPTRGTRRGVVRTSA